MPPVSHLHGAEGGVIGASASSLIAPSTRTEGRLAETLANSYRPPFPGPIVRPLIVVVGVIVLLMGVAWALQGAYVLPATFMRGPEWIATGSAVAVLGLIIALFGFRRPRSAEQVS